MKRWYDSSQDLATIPLVLLSWVFRALVAARRFCYRVKLKKSHRFAVPVIVVGNITVGGTGKTPLVLWLVNFLKEQGFRPGIVSRGVGGKQQRAARWVERNSDPKWAGDEAVLLARQDCPVVIGIDRVAAVQELLAKSNCNIVISDDGLQHYRMGRDVEIVVIDGMRGLGNQRFLPAGPLRESPARLKTVDYVVKHVPAFAPDSVSDELVMKLQGNLLVSVKDAEQRISLNSFQNATVHAIAAIGNPERFFSLLRHQGLTIIEHTFSDHYLYQPQDFNFNDKLPIVMTEKDAVKCENFADERFWFLPVRPEVSARFGVELLEKLSLSFP